MIQSTQGASRKPVHSGAKPSHFIKAEDEFFEQALVKRLLSRMAEKSKQLEQYCAPVLLAVSVPDILGGHARQREIPPLDLQRLVALVAGVLGDVPQFSGILLTLWNAPAQQSRNPIRIRQVFCVTRPSGDSSKPRVRLLAVNPFARYPLTPRELHMVKKAM